MTPSIKPSVSRKNKKLKALLKPNRVTKTSRVPPRMPVITKPPVKDEQELNLNDVLGLFKTLKISTKPRARPKPRPAPRRKKSTETPNQKRLQAILERA
tara:strand:- start:1034 stop:1330 length:297 start_codon:yes stop_codon:yes gene_type:complete